VNHRQISSASSRVEFSNSPVRPSRPSDTPGPKSLKTSHLGDGFKQQFGGTRHAQVDRVGVDCPQLGNRQDAVDAVFRSFLARSPSVSARSLGWILSRLLHPLAFPLDHFGGAGIS